MGEEQKRFFDETYDILEKIGSGSGGTVYSAYHKRLKKLVVLKKISERAAGRLDTRVEADTLKNLKHPFLPQVLDFLERNDGIYTVMDFISGQTLEQCMLAGKKFTQNQIVKYARQLCEALSYLHGQKVPIIHSDIKPSNIMLTLEDNICLIDFNVSAYLDEGNMAVTGCTIGYAAPEQYYALIAQREKGVKTASFSGCCDNYSEERKKTLLLSEKEETEYIGTDDVSMLQPENNFAGLDVRSDIYSLGVTLYHLITGKMPSGDYQSQLILHEGEGNVSEALVAIINKAVQLKPEMRFQSADEMLSTLNQIAKTDKRYKALLQRQKLMNIICIIFLSGSIGAIYLGTKMIQNERWQRYTQMVTNLEEIQDKDIFEENYQQCLALFPDAADAYIAKAAFLYEKGDYENGIRFISEILNTHDFSDNAKKGDFHYIQAGCQMEMLNIDEAIVQYQNALSYNAQNVNYYRDYAVALAKKGEIVEAQGVLEQAQEKGLGADSIYLVSGEIYAASGDMDRASEQFQNCIQQTEDNYLKFRAYVMWSRLYDTEKNDVDALLKKLSILSQAREALPAENQALIYEQLVQTYIDLNMLTEEKSYLQDALGTLGQIVANGWGSYNTHNNIAVMKEQLEDYAGAEAELQKMLSEYGETYDIYKRMAMIEIQKQSKRELANRDYHLFAEYYDKSEALFAQSGKEKDSDMEMAVLEQAYRQVEAGNWLEK